MYTAGLLGNIKESPLAPSRAWPGPRSGPWRDPGGSWAFACPPLPHRWGLPPGQRCPGPPGCPTQVSVPWLPEQQSESRRCHGSQGHVVAPGLGGPCRASEVPLSCPSKHAVRVGPCARVPTTFLPHSRRAVLKGPGWAAERSIPPSGHLTGSWPPSTSTSPTSCPHTQPCPWLLPPTSLLSEAVGLLPPEHFRFSARCPRC